MKTAIAAALVAAFCCAAAPVAGQSLADVAKKEEARRGAVRAKAKTLTNADLTTDPRDASPAGGTSAMAAAAPRAGTAAAAPGNASADGQVAPPEPPAASAKEEVPPESWWRTRAQAMRARIAQARKSVEELTVPPSEDERQQAKVAKLLKAAQEALGRAEQDLKNLEMHADVAGVPATWIK